jgi:TP901 family phage tail tape measure protein
MANEAKLNLVISARDEAKQVIESFVSSILSMFDGMQSEITKAFDMAPIERSVSEATAGIRRSFEELNVGPIVEEQFRGVTTAAQETNNQISESISGIRRTFEELSQTIGQAASSAEGGFRNISQSASECTQQVSESAGNMGHAMQDVGALIAAQMIGDQLQEIGKKGEEAFLGAVNSAATFEFNMSRVGAVLTTVGKASNSQMQQMAEAALSLGSHSAFSANEISQGMYTLARQGLDASTILGDGVNGAINIVNDLAQATDSSLTDTATVITDIVHEFGLSGSSLRDVANIMSGTLHNSSESLQDLYMSMRQVGPIASSMHQSVGDVSTALALLAQHGITGSQAGTAMKNMLLGLEPRTKKAADLMKELGINAKNGAANSFYDLQGNLKPMPEILDILNQKFGGMNDQQKQAALAATFTKYGLAGLNIVVGESRDKFLEFQKELKMDDAATIAGKKYDNLHGDLIKFQAAVSTMGKSFGDTLGPALRGIVQEATKFVQWMTALPKPVKEAGLVALGLASALAIVAGSVISFGIAMAFMKPGFELLGGVIGKVGGSFLGFGATAGRVGGMLRAVSFAPLLNGVRGLVSVLGSGAGRLLTFGGIFNIIKRPVVLFLEGISNLHHIVPAAFSAIQGAIGKAASFIVTSIPRMSAAFLRFSTLIYTSGPRILAAMLRAFSWTNIVSIVQRSAMLIRAAMTLMMGPWGLLIAAVVGGVAFLITHWSQVTQWVKQHFGSEMPGTLNHLKTTFTQVWNNIKTAVEAAWNYIKPTIINGIQEVQKWWNQVWPEIRQVLDVTWKVCLAILAPAIAMIGTIIVAGIGYIKGAWQNGWNAIKDVLKFAWDLISGVVSTAWHLISGIIQVGLDLLTGHWGKAWNDIKSTFSNVWNDIKGTFGKLIGDALDFGKNFVMMIAKGITGAVGNVVSAVSGVADKIKGFLGFHSPTELGPASDSDTWGPNFVNMISQGIKDKTPQIQAAVNGIALSMKTGVTSVNQNIQQNRVSIPSVQNNQQRPVSLTIQVDGRSAKTDKELVDMIADKFYKQIGMVST